MKKFSKKSKCSKCGNTAIRTKYCKNQADDFCWAEIRPASGMEHLDKNCVNCGYAWTQEVLNKGE